MTKKTLPPDLLNEIGVLKRREIEARILLPFVQALEERFNPELVRKILAETVIWIAEKQGKAMADAIRESGRHPNLDAFSETLTAWTKDGALEMEILAQDGVCFEFNVHRCEYAEMYRALGIPELGTMLSCSRDAALISGYDPEIHFQRTQTLMEGAPYCDFRYATPFKNGDKND